MLSYMAVSINWSALCGCPLKKNLLFGVHSRAPDFRKLPYMSQGVCYGLVSEICLPGGTISVYT